MGRPRCRKWAAAGVAGRCGGTSRGPPGVTPVDRRLSGRLVPKSTLDFTTTIRYTAEPQLLLFVVRSAADSLCAAALFLQITILCHIWWSLNAEK